VPAEADRQRQADAPGSYRFTRRALIVGGAGLGLVGMVCAGALLRRPSTRGPVNSQLISTTTIARETLVDVTTAPGRLGFGPEQLVESRLTGTVTGVPPAGTVVERGEVLFRINDTPVILLYGTLPAYRALTAGQPGIVAGEPSTSESSAVTTKATKGADVRQFETNLKALGYNLTVDDKYTEQTAVAVRRWQKDLSLEQSGVVELGRVFYSPGPLRVARHRLAPGAVATGPVLACTGAARLVTAKLPAYEATVAKVHSKAKTVLASGKELTGTVISVAATAAEEEQGSQGAEPELTVVVSPDDPAALDGFDDGPVRVQFVAQERKDVLVVPVGALLALAEGGYGLEIVDGGNSRIVAVTPGLFSNGKVEVSGPLIKDGMTVGMAR
jgi:peptidoglycan hydrolase-like protein with peptidoglycan-binding domain